MVYEMLAGEPPFTGPTAQVVMARHATAPVPALRIIRTTVPHSVDAAIAKAMNKVPADRFASVTDFIAALAALGPQPVGLGTDAGERRRSIVVLPFENHSAESDTDYLSDGLSDEILTDLSTIHALGVISRTSAMQLKGTKKDVRTIGRELGVQYVLEGSVTKANGNIRVTTKLVDATTDELLWADKFRGKMADVFEIQESISRTVVDALKVRLTGAEQERLAERPIPDIEAFEYYLRAKHEILRFTEDALQRALEYLDKGLAILGDNVLIQGAIGYVNWQYVNAGISGDHAYLDRARQCAERIFTLEPHSPDGHRLLGLLELHGGTPQGVAHHLKIALERRHNDTDALLWLSLSYGFAGHAGAAQPLVTRLLQIDPLTSFYQMLPGFLSLMEGDVEGAVAPFRKAHALEPENPIIQTTYGQILAMNDRLEEAYAVFDLANQAAPDSFFARVGQFYTYALQGNRDKALAVVNEELAAVAGADLQYSWSMAECFALVGETEKAVWWIKNAVEQGLWNYPLVARYDPFLVSIREDEAFKVVMKDLKEKWDTFEV
jgi:non-specific serine/threonine protein kinase